MAGNISLSNIQNFFETFIVFRSAKGLNLL